MSTPLRLTGARIIDGTGAAPIPDGVLITDDAGRITYAGPAIGAPETPDIESRDIGGRTLLPGFIDCHVHFGMTVADGPFHALNTDPNLITFEAAQRMRNTLEAGITTARDLAGLSAGYRVAVERGIAVGPRLHVGVRVISHTAGHGDFHMAGGEMHLHGPGLTEIADTPEQSRIAVRRLLRDGADVIKICTTGGMGSPHDHPEDEGLRIAEVQAVVDELDRHGGRPLASHAQGTTGIHTAILGGVTSIEHGYGIDPEGIDLAGERGVILVPTLSTIFAGIDKNKMQPYHYEKKVRWSEITKINIARAIEQGTTIAMGTDAGVCPHGYNLKELGFMADLGMSSMNTIIAATSNAARLLGIDGELGTLAAGKIADFVVSKVDPLADINALGEPDNIAIVAKDGVLYKDLLSQS